MSGQIRLCLLQIGVGPNKAENLEKTKNTIDNLEKSPDIVITPEYLMGLQDGELTKEFVRENAEPIGSNFTQTLCDKAKKSGFSLLFATYREEDGLFFNSSVFVDETREVRGIYDKTHLFDASGYEESDIFQRGENIVVFEWKKFRIGLAMCFDLRFPELFQIMRSMGADLILVPSAFYSGPYKADQWRSLISARAHENNMFVVGVNQPSPHFIGESMVASPLGYVVDRLNKKEKIKVVEVDMGEISEARKKMPTDELARLDFYKRYEPYR